MLHENLWNDHSFRNTTEKRQIKAIKKIIDNIRPDVVITKNDFC